MIKALAIFLATICLSAELNAQYFSASDGITVGRLGKRSYLYNLLRVNPSKQHEIDFASNNPNEYHQIDKLSSRRFFGKFVKRPNDFENQSNEDNNDSSKISTDDENLLKEFLAKYFSK